MEDRLKVMMRELGNAINDSLSESDRIAEAIGGIKASGFDVFLVLEATIGFTKSVAADREAEPPRVFSSAGKVKFTSQDERFLKALKIAVPK